MDGEVKITDNLILPDENKELTPGGDQNTAEDVFSGTITDLENLVKKFSYYQNVMGFFKEGEGKVELKKRFMLKMIDEEWVRMIEDTIPSLDVIIRNPGRLLQEEEELRPIEQTRKVTSRSIIHLSQHTDLINEIRRDGTVMPAKLMNVFQDETVLTYENRFINTLINRLYAFVCVRVDAAEECGTDEKLSTLSFDQTYIEGEKHGKISLKIEIAEKPREHEVVKNYIYTSDLWKRVLRLRRLVTSYMDSGFAHSVGKNYVRPPIMRTNVLLKNVDFRQCLTLWEFLESYENLGYETLIQEDVENVSDDLLKDFYNSLAEQYVLFQKHVRNYFDFDNALDMRGPVGLLPVEIKDELDPLSLREYDFTNKIPDGQPEPTDLSEEAEELDFAVRVALAVDDFFVQEEQDNDEEAELEDGQILYRYRYSFMSRLILAGNPTQDFYTEVKNYLLSFKRVKSRVSWNHETFNAGRKKCARLNVKGKTLYLYIPVNIEEMDKKYHLQDVSDSKSNKDYPTLHRIRSDRGVKWAKELIDIVMQSLGIEKLENPEYIDYHMPYATREEMATWDPPLVKIIGADGTELTFDKPEDETKDSEKPEETLESGEEEIAAAEEDIDSDDDNDDFDDDDEDGGGFNPVDLLTDQIVTYRYRYSFTARLIQADKKLQSFYGEVKNYVLSYNKVRSSIAWGHESFRFGRNTLIKFKMRGKSLAVFFALNPGDYVDTKYNLKDLTTEEKTPPLPLVLKVRSLRGVKWAKELIDDVMKAFGAVQGDIPEVDYTRDYMTTEQLMNLQKPLVKAASVVNGKVVKGLVDGPIAAKPAERHYFQAKEVTPASKKVVDGIFAEVFGLNKIETAKTAEETVETIPETKEVAVTVSETPETEEALATATVETTETMTEEAVEAKEIAETIDTAAETAEETVESTHEEAPEETSVETEELTEAAAQNEETEAITEVEPTETAEEVADVETSAAEPWKATEAEFPTEAVEEVDTSDEVTEEAFDGTIDAETADDGQEDETLDTDEEEKSSPTAARHKLRLKKKPRNKFNR